MEKQVFGLGDVVRLKADSENTYSHCTVCKVNQDGTVNLFRPYTHTADFSYTGGVICYVGIENIDSVNTERLNLIRKGPSLK